MGLYLRTTAGVNRKCILDSVCQRNVCPRLFFRPILEIGIKMKALQPRYQSIIQGSNCGSVKPEINRRYCSYLVSPVMSPSWTGKSKSWSSSLDGTRNPSVVQDVRLDESLRPTDFSVSSAVSSDMLTLQYTHRTTDINNRELSVRTIHRQRKLAWG